MARVRKVNPTLDTLCFSTPEQKLLKFLILEPTTNFTPRALSSKLKGVRGLGGADGIKKTLKQFEEIGLVQFVNNDREVCLQNDAVAIKILKTFAALTELEGLRGMIQGHASRCVLFGSRAKGEARSDSDFDLFVVSDQPEEVTRIVTSHPLGKKVDLAVWKNEDYLEIEGRDPNLAERVNSGILMWGSSW